MGQHRSIAERYRAHREAFALALELGCTPREAEAELRRRAAIERDMHASHRLAAKLAEPLNRADATTAAAMRDEPWMMRD